MKESNMVIDYIIEQSDRYDIKNMQFEQDIIFMINRQNDLLYSRISSINSGVETLLKVNSIMQTVEKYYRMYNTSVIAIIKDAFKKYYDIAYDNTSNLIDIGNEVYGRLEHKIKEIQHMEYGPTNIEYIRDHSLELIRNHSVQRINQMRAMLGDMYLRGNVTKANVRIQIAKVLEVNKSKAEEIAQTELSRAYNYGTLYRLDEYQSMNPDRVVKKYWHGFKYAQATCTYCRPRIGNVYNLNEVIETLPAHVRCRCVWLPMLDGWDKPVSINLITRANMLNTAYSKEMIYSRINNRLGIDYGNYIDTNSSTAFMSGDRSQKVLSAIATARENAIIDKIDSFDVATKVASQQLSQEYTQQMTFWKKLTAQAIIDKDYDLLDRSSEAIKGVMVLPWNGEQMDNWNKLLNILAISR